MDFMKVFDQTVREIKREVNLKVLQVPEMEQALAVIDYLISNGSERAVDEIIEHMYQISSLTSFEYVKPNGKDVGINVRKKAENIVALLNNKEKISEIRDKATINRNNTDHDNLSSGKKSPDSGKHSSIPSHASAAPSNNDDDFDDFDPRGSSSNKPSTGSANQVDIFGADLIGDFLDSGPTETSSTNNNGKFQESDLFADATFVSASSKKASLADVGVVRGLSNDEGNKASAAAYYSGWSMGAGSGLGKTGLYSAQQQQQQQTPEISDGFFSSLSNQRYHQSGGFKQ
uniref:ENTH domain-containing protein n=1 Tax=Brassica campestris TaxID=3711 RepID=M4CXJ5_BRACM